ncbi:MAG TPA: hypothetical protein P5277_03215 [Candidatus Paceibacterota bacterium]|nr:hypothetical protein [Candidatus Paceibacterota bacterium]
MEETEKKENNEIINYNSQEKIKKWLKNPTNLTVSALFLFIVIVRLYYFFITVNQPLWWDEAEYMSAAKGFAGILDYKIGLMRLPTFSLLMSTFFITGLSNEIFMRFIALFIPSIIVLFLFYFVLREMYYDKRIAFISTLILSLLWEHLFFSNRFHTENFSLIFEFLVFFVLFRVCLKKKNLWLIKPKNSLFFIIIFSILSILFRPGTAMFIPAVFLFFVAINKSFIFKKRNLLYTIGFVSIAGILGFFIASKFGLFAYLNLREPISWIPLTMFYGFFQSVIPKIPSIFFYTFLFGLFLVFFDIFTNLSKIKRINDSEEDLEIKSDLLNLLVIISVMVFFIFIMRANAFEFRWFFPLLIPLLAFTSKGAVFFADFVGSFIKNKKIILIIIILIVGIGCYNQLIHADQIIKIKVDSYSQVKDSGLWLKNHTSKDDLVVSASSTQTPYYSERKTIGFIFNSSNSSEEIFNEKIKELKPKYIVISVFEPSYTPEWVYTWPQRNNQSAIPVQVYYSDLQQTQPLLVIYEIKY